MTANVVAVRAIYGRSQFGNRCRFCNEIETLSHVLGSCQRGYLLRNIRHNAVRSTIAKSLREKNYQVFEEVSCISETDSNRRIDMIAITGRKGFVIDPTIRFEFNENQPDEVNNEKKQIYEPCIPDLKSKYNLDHIEVIGLMFGARGTITSFFNDFRKKFGLPKNLTTKLVNIILKGSCKILHNHIYNTSNYNN